MSRYYLAGKMRGMHMHNYPLFFQAAKHLRNVGHEIVSPAEITCETLNLSPMQLTQEILDNVSYSDAMAHDYQAVLDCDGIVLLPGWETSEGTCAERFMCETLDKPVFLYEPFSEDKLMPAPPWDRPNLHKEEAWELGTVIAAYSAPDESAPFPEMHLDAHAAARQGGVGSKVWDSINREFQREEVRVTNPDTGGQKGSKLERYDLIPVKPLAEVARLYGQGAKKYAERNWELGYKFSLSYAALQRHANAFWSGETYDPEHGLNHLAAVAFHCFAMMEWLETHPEMDDRPK